MFKRYKTPLVLCIAALSHASYVFNGFVWLDHGDIEQGRAVLPLNNVFSAFVTPFGQTAFYRPVVTIFHSVDAALYHEWAPGFHITNILLHASVVGAAILFFRKYFQLTEKESILAAILVGIHPLSWLPVGAISYRSELLVVLFTLLTISLHIWSRTVKNDHRVVIVVALTLLVALFSKETALFWIPALIIGWELITKRNNEKKLTGFTLFAAELITTALYILLRSIAVPESWYSRFATLSISEAVGTRIVATGKLLMLLVNPLKPPLSDATPVFPLTHPFPLAIIAAIGIGMYFIIRSPANKLKKLLFFVVVALLPAFNIVPLPRFTSAHYGYFATVGVGTSFVLLHRWLGRKPAIIRSVGHLAIVVWIVIATITTLSNGPRFHNDVSLFQPEVENDQNFREGQFYLGNYYFFEKKEFNKAQQYYEIALYKDPKILAFVDSHSARINLAGVYTEQKRFEEAEQVLKETAKTAPPYLQSLIQYNLTVIARRRLIELH